MRTCKLPDICISIHMYDAIQYICMCEIFYMAYTSNILQHDMGSSLDVCRSSALLHFNPENVFKSRRVPQANELEPNDSQDTINASEITNIV